MTRLLHGGAMEESEESAFAAFDVKPAASSECISSALGPSVGIGSCVFLAGKRRVVGFRCPGPWGP